MDVTSAGSEPELVQGNSNQTGPEVQPWTQILAALAGLREAFDAKIRYDEVRERQIAALHQELEAHRRGLYQQILRPVLTDLIGVYDEIASLASAEPAPEAGKGNDTTACGASVLLESVKEILLRHTVTTFTCEDDNVDRSRQKVIDVAPTDRAELDRRVARRVRPGFEADGKVLRPEWIVAYRYAPDARDPEVE